MSEKESSFDWVLALILYQWQNSKREHEKAMEAQRALIKPFWWESK